jgi:hypothetical protein
MQLRTPSFPPSFPVATVSVNSSFGVVPDHIAQGIWQGPITIVTRSELPALLAVEVAPGDSADMSPGLVPAMAS